MIRVPSSSFRPRRPAGTGASGASRVANRFRPAMEALEGRAVMDVGIGLDPVSGLSDLANPVLVTPSGDATGRLFVVEQGGRILARQPDGTVGVFLDISASATDPAQRRVQAGGEQGLIGLAFHPQFESNGRFFVHHTRLGLDNTNDIVEYRVDPGNPNVADPSSEQLLLRIPQPFSNHNGGSIAFGPDGLLYIGKGDGGSSNDPGNNAQNIDSLLGKVLRIDVGRDDFPADPARNYGIPADNPYVGGPGADEVFAIGLRNPYRFSFDRGTGLLYVGDVGQGTREEIDVVTIGGNYGWRPFEGNVPTPGIDPAEGDAIRPTVTFPVTDLDRTLARSITGGFVYRGAQGTLPSGSYLFGDFITGNLFLLQDGSRSTLMDAGFNVSSFGEDEAGELYVVRYGGGSGVVYKVVSTSENRPPDLAPIADRTIPAGQDTVTVTLSATDPDGDPLTFAATSRSLALDVDAQLGLRTDGGNLWENWGGRGEKWLLDRGGAWHIILPNGELYRWDGSSQATGTLVASLGATYHARPDLLYNAQEVSDLDAALGLRTDGGNLWENWGGRGEKWLLDRGGAWHIILPNGELYRWDGSSQATGTLVATPGPSYHALVGLLHEGDRGQALASVALFGSDLTIGREDGLAGSVVVTVTALDPDGLTDQETFTVTVAS